MDYANLQISVDSRGITQTNRQLDQLATRGARAERATDGLRNEFTRLATVATAVVAAYQGLSEIVRVTREFDVFNAQLETVTGSSENAARAFAALQEFAATTPFDLGQSVTAFIKLVNLGLDPSAKSLTSWGNAASATGLNLDALVQSVGQATLGEFESLKQLGIKARVDGDEINFIFKGISTNVKNEASAIEGYLLDLADTNFSGAIERRAESLDGALSNLGDSYEQLLLTISNEGFADVFEDGVRTAIGAFDELNESLSADQFSAYVDAVLTRYGRLVDGVLEDNQELAGNFKVASDSFDEFFVLIGNTIDENDLSGKIVSLGEGLLLWPEYAAYAVTGLENEFNALDSQALPLVESFVDKAILQLSYLADQAGVYGREFFDSALGLNFYNHEQALAQLKSNLAQATSTIEDGLGESLGEIEGRRSARADQIELRLKTAIEQYYADLDAVDALDDGPKTDNTGVLGGFRAEGEESGPTKSQRTSFERVEASLRSEEEAIEASYSKRLETITNWEEATGVYQTELRNRLEEERAEQLLEINGSYWDRYLLAAEESLTSFDELALSTVENFSTGVGDAFADAILGAESFGDAFEDVAKGLLRNTVSALGKMAAEWVAFRIVQSITNKTAAASSAAAQGVGAQALSAQAGLAAFASTAAIPVVGPAAAPAAAAAAIAATQPIAATVGALAGASAGLYDLGGMIPAGQSGIVGEYGPELIAGPAVVTSRRATADKGGSTSRSPITIKAVYHIDARGSDAGSEERIRTALEENNERLFETIRDERSRGLL